MKSACLVDTNVLVYAYDPVDAFKRDRAAAALAGLGAHGVGVLSPQIVGEFFVVVTRRIAQPLSLAEAERSITHYLRSWRMCELTGWTVLEAVLGVSRHKLNYWDALIWATAKLGEVPLVLSEDFQHGRIIEGVRFVNPFRPEFDLQTLVPV